MGNGTKRKKWIERELLSVTTDETSLSLFRLAFPLFLNLISASLISFVQTIISKNYLDGFFIIPLTISATAFSFLQVIVMLLGSGVSILLSVHLGRKDADICKKIVGNALVLSVVFSCAVALVGWLASEPLLSFMGLNKAEYSIYRPYASCIFKWRMIELVIWSVGNVAISCLRSYGYTSIGFVAGLVSNIINVAGTVVALLVLNVPKESAATTLALILICSSVGFTIIGGMFLLSKKIPFVLHINGKLCGKIFKIGIPAGISQIFYALSQVITTSICTYLTPTAYLAKTYITQIVQFVSKFGYSIGQANAIMVGRLCGMGDYDRADRLCRNNLKITELSNMTLSIFCLIFGKSLLRLCFNADVGVLAFSLIFALDIVVEFGRGMNHVGENGLNATGDVKFTTIVSILSCWTFSVGLSYIFVVVFHWSLYGMWIAFSIDELFRGILYYIRWRKQSWRKKVEQMYTEKSESKRFG